jgi:glycosyltransferase involved in cell wall biosynthesis
MLAAQAQDDPAGAAAASRKLSVAGVDPELRFGGGEVQVLGLTMELLRRGHRAELICDPRGRLFERARAAGVRCHPLAIRNSIDMRAALKLRHLLRSGRYDIVHFHTARAHALAPWVGGLAAARVVTRRMDYRPNRLFAPWLYNRAVEGVAAISTGVVDALAEAGVARSRIALIPSGIDESRFRPPTPAERAAARSRWQLGDDQLAIGTVGALEPRKGHRVMLAAFATLAKGAGAPLIWLAAGEGSLTEPLRQEVRRIELEERVRFVGQLEDSRELLWALDLFAMPSLKEGLGVALLEAMGCGLAAVASDVGGTGAAIAGGAGLAVAPDEPDRLAGAIRRLAGSEAMRRELGATARARVLERYTLGASAEATLKFYFNSLESSGRRGA